jgi:hypothetical protein
MKLGPIPQNGMMTYLDTTGDLKLFGRYGIIGRSIKIHGTEDVCAKIISSVEMTNTRKVTMLQASFTYPVGGTIYMRQVEGEDAIIFGKIYWVDSSMATMNHNWHVHINQVRGSKVCGNYFIYKCLYTLILLTSLHKIFFFTLVIINIFHIAQYVLQSRKLYWSIRSLQPI